MSGVLPKSSPLTSADPQETFATAVAAAAIHAQSGAITADDVSRLSGLARTVDLRAMLNTPHLPADAGEFGEKLAKMLNRIPDGWGRWIGVQRGWYEIVTNADASIAALFPDYEIHQVKEKYGTLRYYCSVEGDPRVEQIIDHAEALSAVTCETCGQPGRLGSNAGWWMTTCDACEPDGFIVE